MLPFHFPNTGSTPYYSSCPAPKNSTALQICMYPCIILRAEQRQRFFKSLWVVLLAGLYLAFHFGCWVWGLHHTSLTHALLLVSTTPVVLAIAALVMRQPISTGTGCHLDVQGVPLSVLLDTITTLMYLHAHMGLLSLADSCLSKTVQLPFLCLQDLPPHHYA